jgi:hypothetical protein
MKKKKEKKPIKKKAHILHVIVELSDGTMVIVNKNKEIEKFNFLDLTSDQVKK